MIVSMATALLVSSSGAAASSWNPSRGPWIVDETQHSLEVRWVPPSGMDAGTLTLDTGGSWGMTAKATVTEGIARARVEGLEPDTSFHYRVTEGDHHTAAFAARTLPGADAPVDFVIFGDTRTDDDAHAKVSRAIAATAPDFVLNTGDLVENGATDVLWGKFFEDERPLLASSLMLPADGNHDEHSFINLDDTELPKFFSRNPWYEFTDGAVRIIILDTNRPYDADSTQGKWLRAKLDAAKADRAAGKISWIFTAHHFPPYSSSGHGSDKGIQKELVPLYRAAGVDCVFTGHNHNYERLESEGITYFVTGGGGAPLYDFPATVLPESKVHAKVHHFLHVKADAKVLSVDAIDVDGNVIDHFVLDAGRPRPHAQVSPLLLDRHPSTLAAVAMLLAGVAAWAWSSRFS